MKTHELSAPGPATGDRDLRDMVRSLFDGKSNNTGTVTLRASQPTTVLDDPRIGGRQHDPPDAADRRAAAAHGGARGSARAAGAATLSHASTVATDQAFAYAVVG